MRNVFSLEHNPNQELPFHFYWPVKYANGRIAIVKFKLRHRCNVGLRGSTKGGVLSYLPSSHNHKTRVIVFAFSLVDNNSFEVIDQQLVTFSFFERFLLFLKKKKKENFSI